MVDPHITEIEQRAAAQKVPLDEVLKTAGVAKTTWYRWHASKNGPTLKTLRRLHDALDRLADAA